MKYNKFLKVTARINELMVLVNNFSDIGVEPDEDGYYRTSLMDRE